MIELTLSLLLAVGAHGVGARLLLIVDDRTGDRLEAACFSLALGFGSLALIVFALGVTSLLYTPVLLCVTVCWFALGSAHSYRAIRDLYSWLIGQKLLHFRSVYFWISVVALAAMLLNCVQAMVPPHGATDPLAYHLALPKAFLRAHMLSFEPTINGALYPNNIGLLYVVVIALGSRRPSCKALSNSMIMSAA